MIGEKAFMVHLVKRFYLLTQCSRAKVMMFTSLELMIQHGRGFPRVPNDHLQDLQTSAPSEAREVQRRHT